MKERLYGRSKGLWIIIWSCRNLPELQGPRNRNEFRQSVTMNNLALILTELEEHATCQYRMHDALKAEEIFYSYRHDSDINNSVRREEISEAFLENQ